MNDIITNEEKKVFLEWFLESYELQKKEGTWLLTYVLSDADVLKNVHFVDETVSSARSILMSTQCVDQVPFQFKKGKLLTEDVERAFHDIRLHPEEDIFITLLFHKSESCPKYAAVREVDPMEKYKLTSNNLYSLFAEMVLDEAIERFQKEKLYKQINQSLEEQDKEKFLLLSQRWMEFQEKE